MRVNSDALFLMKRQSEINRRIRDLHRVIRQLRHLANDSTFNNGDTIATHKKLESGCGGAKPNGFNASSSFVSSRRASSQSRFSQSGFVQSSFVQSSFVQSSFVQSRRSLSRACRIALLEAGGPATLDEIRARILRRRSFSFPDPGMVNVAILRTLNRMTSEGEIVCLGHNSHKLWQRVEWTG